MNWALVVPLLGVIFAPILTYMVARRTTSGRVDTTEAATLWAEAKDMRNAYQAEADRLRSEVAAVKVEVDVLRVKTEECERESRALRAEVAGLAAKEARLQGLHDECERLCERLARLHEQDQKELQAEKDKR